MMSGKNESEAAAISNAIGMRVAVSHLRLPIVSMVLKAGIPKMKLTAPGTSPVSHTADGVVQSAAEKLPNPMLKYMANLVTVSTDSVPFDRIWMKKVPESVIIEC